jgi:hypothetical protein
MSDSIQYLSSVNWHTIVRNVILLTEEDVNNPATYRVTVNPNDINEAGANLPIEIDYYVIDYAGNMFRIISVNGYVVDVEDSFRCNWCPKIGFPAKVYQSVGDGVSPFIPPVDISQLDKSADDYSRKIVSDILWRKPNNFNIKWHPIGVVFSFDAKSVLDFNYTSGSIALHEWYQLSEYKISLGRPAYNPIRSLSITSSTDTLLTNTFYHVFAKIPLSEGVSSATIIYSIGYKHEAYYEGFMMLLLGTIDTSMSPHHIAMLWENMIAHEDHDKLFGLLGGGTYHLSAAQIAKLHDPVTLSQDTITGGFASLDGQELTVYSNVNESDTVFTGAVDGVNATFTLPTTFKAGSSHVYINGQRLKLGVDYTEVGGNSITFIIPPFVGDLIIIDVAADVSVGGTLPTIVGEQIYVELIGPVDGTNKIFGTPDQYVAGKIIVFLNGIAEHFITETSDTAITFQGAPLKTNNKTDIVSALYIKK